MENKFLGVIFLSAYFLALSTAQIFPGQDRCKEGEPLASKFSSKDYFNSREIRSLAFVSLPGTYTEGAHNPPPPPSREKIIY